MNVLVAGGAGFIGSHLIDCLLTEDHKVICADKLIMGNKNIQHLMGRDDFAFCAVELTDQDKVDRIFAEYDIGAVYHLAANSDIQKAEKILPSIIEIR